MLDTDTCSAHLRRPAQLAHRFVQYSGQLAISSVVLAELFAGAYMHPQSARLVLLIRDLQAEVSVLDFDSKCAERFGTVRGSLKTQGLSIATADLMIAAVALVHDLTLVTHNTAHFRSVPGLRLDDWLIP